jgi:hypothetical protein
MVAMFVSNSKKKEKKTCPQQLAPWLRTARLVLLLALTGSCTSSSCAAAAKISPVQLGIPSPGREEVFIFQAKMP